MKAPEVVNLSVAEKDLLLESVTKSNVEEKQKDQIKGMIRSFTQVCLIAQERRASILRIRKVLGIKTEKIVKDSEALHTENEDCDQDSQAGVKSSTEEKKRLLAGVMGRAGASLFPSLRF